MRLRATRLSAIAQGIISNAPSWTPTQISTALWLDAADASTLVLNGATVSQWNDKSGNGRNVSQANATKQPTSGTRTINSRNTLDFDGTGDVLSTTSVPITAGKDAYSYAAVWSTDVFGVFQVIMEQNLATVTTNRRGALRTHSGAYGFHGEGQLMNPVPYAANTVFLSVMRVDNNLTINGTNNIFVSNSGSPFSGTTSSPSTLDVGADIFNVGAKVNSTEFFNGMLAELLVFDNLISNADRQKLEGYLAWKWGGL